MHPLWPPQVDEPESNHAKAITNKFKYQNRQAQLAADRAAEAARGTALNNRGEPAGRKRNKPKYNDLVMNYHAGQFGSTMRAGPVPSAKCPSGCIDDATRRRYGFNLEGNCLCPVCANNCRKSYTPTAHQMSTANQILEENHGKLNTVSTNITSTCPHPPASVIGAFHRTAEDMGDIIICHAHSGV